MAALRERILALLRREGGLTDRQIADRLLGAGLPQQSTNQACRQLADLGHIIRRKASDGLIRNWVGEAPAPSTRRPEPTDPLSEDALKRALVTWLESMGWTVNRVAWGREQGVDIEASRAGQRWLIEVKGSGSRSAMRVNYFLSALGEALQRMDDPAAKYSVAFPDLQQFRSLGDRLPEGAKQRTGITCLLIYETGRVREVR